MSLNKLLIGVVVIILLVNLVVVGNFLLNRGKGGLQIGNSSNALLFTQPVTTFNGMVESVGEKNLKVSLISTSMEETEKRVFNVIANDQTVITSSTPVVPYLSTQGSQAPTTPGTVSIGTIREGDIVIVTAKEDLRMLKSDTIDAISISIQPKANQLIGTVERNNGSNLVVKGTIPPVVASTSTKPASPQMYNVSITSSTEILQFGATDVSGSATPTQKVSANDIKQGNSVVVYISPNYSGTSVTALLVQLQGVASPVSQSATSSAPIITPIVPTGRVTTSPTPVN